MILDSYLGFHSFIPKELIVLIPTCHIPSLASFLFKGRCVEPYSLTTHVDYLNNQLTCLKNKLLETNTTKKTYIRSVIKLFKYNSIVPNSYILYPNTQYLSPLWTTTHVDYLNNLFVKQTKSDHQNIKQFYLSTKSLTLRTNNIINEFLI